MDDFWNLSCTSRVTVSSTLSKTTPGLLKSTSTINKTPSSNLSKVIVVSDIVI
jgi:hypothetical protein